MTFNVETIHGLTFFITLTVKGDLSRKENVKYVIGFSV